jgi:hypothetical protein
MNGEEVHLISLHDSNQNCLRMVHITWEPKTQCSNCLEIGKIKLEMLFRKASTYPLEVVDGSHLSYNILLW